MLQAALALQTWSCRVSTYGCFYELGVHCLGVLIRRALLFGGSILGPPAFWKLPYSSSLAKSTSSCKGFRTSCAGHEGPACFPTSYPSTATGKPMWSGAKSNVVSAPHSSFASVESTSPGERQGKACAVSQPTHNQSRSCKVSSACFKLRRGLASQRVQVPNI